MRRRSVYAMGVLGIVVLLGIPQVPGQLGVVDYATDTSFCLLAINVPTSASDEPVDCAAVALLFEYDVSIRSMLQASGAVECGGWLAQDDFPYCEHDFGSVKRLRNVFLVFCSTKCDEDWRTTGNMKVYVDRGGWWHNFHSGAPGCQELFGSIRQTQAFFVRLTGAIDSSQCPVGGPWGYFAGGIYLR